MARSPLEDLSIAHLIDPAKLAAPDRPFARALDLQRNALGLHLGELRPPTAEAAPFRATSVDGRLAEIDDALGAGEAPLRSTLSPSLPRNTAGRPSPRATGSAMLPAVDSTEVHPAIRALPGGHAFALLLPARPARSPLAKNAELARSLPGPRELYLRVREFLRELRSGLFGFQRELLRAPGVQAQLKMQLDSDVELALVGDRPDAAATQQLTAAIARVSEAMRDALALFAKVVELVAALVKAALHPVHAVRTIYQALRGLYDLLVAHYGAS